MYTNAEYGKRKFNMWASKISLVFIFHTSLFFLSRVTLKIIPCNNCIFHGFSIFLSNKIFQRDLYDIVMITFIIIKAWNMTWYSWITYPTENVNLYNRFPFFHKCFYHLETENVTFCLQSKEEIDSSTVVD